MNSLVTVSIAFYFAFSLFSSFFTKPKLNNQKLRVFCTNPMTLLACSMNVKNLTYSVTGVENSMGNTHFQMQEIRLLKLKCVQHAFKNNKNCVYGRAFYFSLVLFTKQVT